MICTAGGIHGRAAMISKAFDELNEQMLLRLLAINPDCATIFGMHDPYDRQLPHGGYDKIRDNLGLLEEWSSRAGEIAERERLSREQDVSLSVLRFTLETYRFVVDDYPLWRMRPDALESPGTAMLMMLVRGYAPLQTRLEAMADRIGQLPRYLEQFRGRFVGARTVRIWTEAALDECKAFPPFMDSAEKLCSAHADREAQSKMAENVALAKEGIQAHIAWLERMLESSAERFAMGKESYEKLMRIRGIAHTPDELLSLAAKYLEEYRRHRESIARRIAGGGTVDEARKIVESDCLSTVDEVVKRTDETVKKAKEFVLEHDIVSIPRESDVHVMRTPGFLEGSTPSASTYLPAVFEKSQDTIFLVSGTDDPKALGSVWNNYAIDSTAVHEAYPGHHHQGVMSNTKPWMHQLPHIMYTPETLSPPYESQEGWATYCEYMMTEKGFLGSDKHQLGLLDYSIWTACRVFSEIKLAREDATVEEMVEFAVKESGYPREYADGDVKGFTRMPGYGVCYLLGRHLVNSLKKDLQDMLGPEFSDKRFNDLVAENGNLPFYLLEEEVRHGLEKTDTR